MLLWGNQWAWLFQHPPRRSANNQHLLTMGWLWASFYGPAFYHSSDIIVDLYVKSALFALTVSADL